jgi:hypothetical protein
MLSDAYQPIVFCRFIDTAEYVAEHLVKALGKNTTVECVTGTLPPAERMERISSLAEIDGPRVLVATDCLSEGVNLQEQFQAVIHYDLAWNPTRHEQREGRVDRFGQRRDVVRAVSLYGRDNQIDGIVLDVLLRKHEAIRKATGVSVPVPDSSDAVIEALMEGLLLRGVDFVQEQLDLGLDAKAQQLDLEWRSAAERESKAVTKYAQLGIHPEEVATELREIRASLGTHAEVRAFVRESLESLRSTIRPVDRGFSATLGALPTGLRDALPPGRNEPLEFVEDFPVARGGAVLHRTDRSVEAIARYVLEAALDSAQPGEHRPARRCAVVRTDVIDRRTTLLIVRYRFHLTLPSRAGETTAVAEDVATLAFVGPVGEPEWLDWSDALDLLDARAVGNVAPQQAAAFMERTLNGLTGVREHLDQHGDALAERLVESHRRVRLASGDIKRGLQVKVERPSDVLGVYVFIPQVGA